MRTPNARGCKPVQVRVTTPGSRRTEARRQAEKKGETTSALSAGSNALLRHGAAPALGVDDVLEAIGVMFEKAKPPPAPEGDAGRVLAELRDTPATVDELARAVGLTAAETTALLMRLELDGLVEVGDGVYRATIAA